MDNLFENDAHDGVVSGSSQRGGLDEQYCTIEREEYKGILGFESNAHHCKTNKWEYTHGNIFSLLTSPFTDERFCMTYFSAPPASRATETESDNEYTFTKDANTFVRFKTCTLEDIDDTRCIHVEIEKSENIIADMVIVTFGEEGNDDEEDDTEVNVDICRNSYYLEIPKDYKGTAQVHIYGKTENRELTIGEQTLNIN